MKILCGSILWPMYMVVVCSSLQTRELTSKGKINNTKRIGDHRYLCKIRLSIVKEDLRKIKTWKALVTNGLFGNVFKTIAYHR